MNNKESKIETIKRLAKRAVQIREFSRNNPKKKVIVIESMSDLYFLKHDDSNAYFLSDEVKNNLDSWAIIDIINNKNQFDQFAYLGYKPPFKKDEVIAILNKIESEI